ncbi:hypothetical protein [Nitrosomonas oligotropha]|uniref:hypothetical protein n=1 Tax=Nitrosomonas oligotropha TaxID=42354 RepID=UPI0013708B63|nr:hypothetical protein [Nitrosomonas oligotropha]
MTTAASMINANNRKETGTYFLPSGMECATRLPDYPERLDNFVACETAHIQK